jgi:hypothetical protein
MFELSKASVGGVGALLQPPIPYNKNGPVERSSTKLRSSGWLRLLAKKTVRGTHPTLAKKTVRGTHPTLAKKTVRGTHPTLAKYLILNDFLQNGGLGVRATKLRYRSTHPTFNPTRFP